MGKKGKISAIVKKGNFMILDGKPFPGIVDGTRVDIIVPVNGFMDERDMLNYGQEHYALMFSAETDLWLNLPSAGSTLYREQRNHPDLVIPGGLQNSYFTKITLKDPLAIFMQGTSRSRLKSCKVLIHLLGEEAISLNQAFTVLSRVYEPQRISHTGNVFRHIYYKKNGEMFPLSKKRDECLEKVSNYTPREGLFDER